ncbi:MAG: ABC transporter permease [Spirochaetes bacterium]|nr:ABC transporter permease [Spirochaetota bacterium]
MRKSIREAQTRAWAHTLASALAQSFKTLVLRTLALTRKELRQYLSAPAFYGAAVFFLVFSAVWLFYFQGFFALNAATLRPYFSAFPVLYIFIVPVITMKSWAEERKTGSIELLLTMPFSEWNLILGKFLSAFTVLLMILALTIPLPLSLSLLGTFDIGMLLSEYTGAALLGASAIALGLLLSCLSKNQAGSFLGTAAALMFTMLIVQLTFAFNLPAWLSVTISYLSLAYHFDSFSRGLLDSRNFAFFVLSTALFLFLNTRVILFRKWK